MKIPQRQSLLLQTTDILRSAVQDGTLSGELPGERELSRRLHVSRPTLRAALEILQREKLIQTAPGKRRTTVQRAKAARRKKQVSVSLVSQVPLYAMSRNRLFLFDYLHRALQEHDIHFDVVSNPAFGSNRPGAALKPLEKTASSRTFILALTSQKVQEWFSEKALRCMIIGSAFPGVKIPSIETDYPATGRHAAGTFLGRGHRHLLLLSPSTNLAGDLETASAFEQQVLRSGHDDAVCHHIQYQNDPADLLAQWEALAETKHKPTAAFSIYPQAAMTLLTHLLAHGVRVPEDFSVLCRDGAPLLEWIRPSIAHYELPLQHFAARLSSLVLEMTTAGSLPLRHIPIMPELAACGSLGPVKTSES